MFFICPINFRRKLPENTVSLHIAKYYLHNNCTLVNYKDKWVPENKKTLNITKNMKFVNNLL